MSKYEDRVAETNEWGSSPEMGLRFKDRLELGEEVCFVLPERKKRRIIFNF